MSELRGGQIWAQAKFPFFRCYLVYLGKEGWCRIQPPDRQGNIAMTSGSKEEGFSGPIYTTEQMEALLTLRNFECQGQFSDQEDAQREFWYDLGRSSIERISAADATGEP